MEGNSLGISVGSGTAFSSADGRATFPIAAKHKASAVGTGANLEGFKDTGGESVSQTERLGQLHLLLLRHVAHYRQSMLSARGTFVEFLQEP